ncbi:MAG: hypothetical protein R3B54_11780 [Bdellovibrionota bacterium]
MLRRKVSRWAVDTTDSCAILASQEPQRHLPWEPYQPVFFLVYYYKATDLLLFIFSVSLKNGSIFADRVDGRRHDILRGHGFAIDLIAEAADDEIAIRDESYGLGFFHDHDGFTFPFSSAGQYQSPLR